MSRLISIKFLQIKANSLNSSLFLGGTRIGESAARSHEHIFYKSIGDDSSFFQFYDAKNSSWCIEIQSEATRKVVQFVGPQKVREIFVGDNIFFDLVE